MATAPATVHLFRSLHIVETAAEDAPTACVQAPDRMPAQLLAETPKTTTYFPALVPPPPTACAVHAEDSLVALS